ncbi:hypothetical protein CCC_03590 [Paramagnetospirillum magnetotacticum MS-1]|uniref:Uncharacterized protein n=1 Tax=Paramagnetospirillum magnetotacticum MS-1 TaxID=272627 RepID=A0A0C2U9Z4_PARME|nr:hypothetical protein CCC_03590 [Paramagnetospirillum magnetotacticum MS-1]
MKPVEPLSVVFVSTQIVSVLDHAQQLGRTFHTFQFFLPCEMGYVIGTG